MNIRQTRWVLVLAALGLVPAARAADWHVNPAGTGDFPTIQAAFDAASPGDTIILAPGTYTDFVTRTIQGHSVPQTTSAVVFMSPGVDIVGSGGADVTTIDGQGDRHGLFGTDLGVSSISGITFYRCARAGGEIWGGGVMLHRSNTVIESCTFRECEAHAGGALTISQGSGAVVRSNLFHANASTGYAGALSIFQHFNALVENNTFVENVCVSLAGALLLNDSTVDLSNNIYANNSGDGAVTCINGAVVTSNCGLYWNNAGGNGGGCGIVIGQNDNLEADPLFCDPANGNYHVQAASPASPAHPSGCGLRGAFDVACGPVSVEPSTWGRIKANYR